MPNVLAWDTPYGVNPLPQKSIFALGPNLLGHYYGSRFFRKL